MRMLIILFFRVLCTLKKGEYMGEEKTPVRFIRCTSEQIQELISASTEAQKETEIKIDLKLNKEPEENPVEKFVEELEKI